MINAGRKNNGGLDRYDYLPVGMTGRIELRLAGTIEELQYVPSPYMMALGQARYYSMIVTS